MNEKFIWNLDEDQIHFVLNYDVNPSKENYITGEYNPSDNSVVLFADQTTAPANVDYFIRLWNATNPDKMINRQEIFVKNGKKMKKRSDMFGLGDESIENIEIPTKEKLVQMIVAIGGRPLVKQIRDLIINYNGGPEDLRRLVSKFIGEINDRMINQLSNQSPDITDDEWKRMTEEQVFQKVREQAKEYYKDNPMAEKLFAQVSMDQWERTGVPLQIRELILNQGFIDESHVDWNELYKEFLDKMISQGVQRNVIQNNQMFSNVSESDDPEDHYYEQQYKMKPLKIRNKKHHTEYENYSNKGRKKIEQRIQEIRQQIERKKQNKKTSRLSSIEKRIEKIRNI
jgi:hypothetical protein